MNIFFTILLTLLAGSSWVLADGDLERVHRETHPAPVNGVAVHVARGFIEVVNGETDDVEIVVVRRIQRSMLDRPGVFERISRDLLPGGFDANRTFARVEPRIRTKGDTLRLDVADSRLAVLDWDATLQMSIEVKITLPRGVPLVVRGVSAGVKLPGDHVGALDVESDGGSFTATKVDGDVRVRLRSGSITINEVRGRSELHSDTGLVLAGHLRGPAELSTLNGSVEVLQAYDELKVRGSDALVLIGVSAPAPKAMDLRIASGELRLNVDRDLGLSLDANASWLGRVKLRGLEPEIRKGGIERSTLRADLAGGGPVARLRTGGANIVFVGRAPAMPVAAGGEPNNGSQAADNLEG